MGLRESINRHPSIAVVPATVAVAAAGLMYFLTVRAGTAHASSGIKSFYTIDDGKTWFKDEMAQAFPFDHHGKLAYRVQVFRCGNGKPFAGYLESYPEDVKSQIESAGTDWNARFTVMQSASDRLLVKRPGDATWISLRHNDYMTITRPVCGDDPKQSPAAVNANE